MTEESSSSRPASYARAFQIQCTPKHVGWVLCTHATFARTLVGAEHPRYVLLSIAWAAVWEGSRA